GGAAARARRTRYGGDERRHHAFGRRLCPVQRPGPAVLQGGGHAGRGVSRPGRGSGPESSGGDGGPRLDAPGGAGGRRGPAAGTGGAGRGGAGEGGAGGGAT